MKAKLDKWDCQVILYCKHWFDKDKEGNPRENINKVDDLRLIYSKRNAINPKNIHDVYLLEYLLNNLVEPFLVPASPRILWEIIEDSSPENCWKVGYEGGKKLSGVQNPNMEYNYTHAMIYNLMSIISISEIKDFPDFPQGLKADSRLIDPEFKPDYNNE